MDPLWTFLRAVNVPLLLAATFGLFVRFSDAWPNTSTGWRLIRIGTLLYFLSGAVISAIRYASHYPVDGFVLLPTTASLLVIAGTWRERHKDPEARP